MPDTFDFDIGFIPSIGVVNIPFIFKVEFMTVISCGLYIV